MIHALHFAAGVVYSNALEWLIHKYVLHGLGRNKSSFWSFHWHDHHRAARKHDLIDESYVRPFENVETNRELAGMTALLIVHAPLAFLSVHFFSAIVVSGAAYYAVHRTAHVRSGFCRKWLPWHADHHLGRDQDANWCVTFPMFDHLLGTRVMFDDVPKMNCKVHPRR